MDKEMATEIEGLKALLQEANCTLYEILKELRTAKKEFASERNQKRYVSNSSLIRNQSASEISTSESVSDIRNIDISERKKEYKEKRDAELTDSALTDADAELKKKEFEIYNLNLTEKIGANREVCAEFVRVMNARKWQDRNGKPIQNIGGFLRRFAQNYKPNATPTAEQSSAVQAPRAVTYTDMLKELRSVIVNARPRIYWQSEFIKECLNKDFTSLEAFRKFVVYSKGQSSCVVGDRTRSIIEQVGSYDDHEPLENVEKCLKPVAELAAKEQK